MLKDKRLMVKDVAPVEATTGVDLRTEAEEVARNVAGAHGKLVVLTGEPRSGKSELIHRWVVPLMSGWGRVFYGECSPGLPAVFECGGQEYVPEWKSLPAGTYFLDSFGRLLSLDEQTRHESIQTIHTAIMQSPGEVTIVLVLRNDRLDKLFSLPKIAPEIALKLFELPTVDFEETLRRLAVAQGGEGFSYGQEILGALNEDLRSFKDKKGSLLLAKLLHPRLVKTKGEVAQYKRAGGLRGFLDEIVTDKLEDLRKAMEAKAVEAGWAILKEVAQQAHSRAMPDLKGISSRLEIAETIVNDAYEWLKGPQGMLHQGARGGVEIEPPQLAERIGEQASQRNPELLAAEKIIEEGARTWRTIGAVLPKKGFDEVNRFRHDLKIDQAAAALMAHCALLYTDEPELKTARYWLGRIPDEREQITSLMRALVAPEPEVRRKAARLLRDRQEPGVAVQLYRVALEDPAQKVRREAVVSLKSVKPMPVELWDALEAEATNPLTPYRRNAVECLQIFPDKQTIELLCKIANNPNDPEVGKAAISTLKAMHTAQSAAALEALGKTTPRAA
jgi:hypothetical protein